jgi:hypothetical protein
MQKAMKHPMSSSAGCGSDETKHNATRGRRPRLPLVALAGLLMPVSAAVAQEAEPLDPEIQFVVDNGFESLFFAQTCRSVGPDGDVIDVEPLPVGGGRQLECETDVVSHLQALVILSSTNEPFCVLGQLSSFSGENVDPSLSVSVTSTPDGAPWTLVGTSEEEISISKVTGPGGGSAFPLAADALFDVIDVLPNPTGQFCPPLFGL